jgi:hypothetical protein
MLIFGLTFRSGSVFTFGRGPFDQKKRFSIASQMSLCAGLGCAAALVVANILKSEGLWLVLGKVSACFGFPFSR